MPHDDHADQTAPDDTFDTALQGLLAGPSPVNMVHGAIHLDGHGPERPSQASIDAAREDILAALWGQL